ncbi:MAG: ABC transporter permease [Gemmatimonadetes bacterium]|nr:ABC transporter permease [Gemmatimonadota bacterium]
MSSNSYASRGSRAFHVAAHTLLETIRDRVFGVSILFSAMLLGAALVLSPLAAGEQDKIIMDLGLAGISVIGLFLALFIGASLVFREVERRSIYTVLSKPIARDEYILGKYCGSVLTIVLNVLMMSVLYVLLVSLHLETFHMGLLSAIYLIALELAVIAAFSLFFSVVSSPFMGAFFTLALFVAGHLARDILHFAELVPAESGRMILKGITYMLPNLEYFNVKGMAVYGKPIPPDLLLFATSYGALYIVGVLLLTMLVFRRKDLQ